MHGHWSVTIIKVSVCHVRVMFTHTASVAAAVPAAGEKPYVCAVQGCGKRFTEYSSLYKHHVVHTHTKPYTCNYCGKTYRQTSTLAMHKRTAHGEGEDSTVGTETVSVNDSKCMIGVISKCLCLFQTVDLCFQ